MQFVTQVEDDNNVLQALLVKIHDHDPCSPDGEYYQIKQLLQEVAGDEMSD